MKVFVGSKSGKLYCLFDSPDADIREVEAPEGYRRVWRGPVIEGDLYLQLPDLIWSPVEFPVNDTYRKADCYMCVVRNDGGDDPIGACERCEVNGRSFGHRFCSYCCGTILLENRQRELAQ